MFALGCVYLKVISVLQTWMPPETCRQWSWQTRASLLSGKTAGLRWTTIASSMDLYLEASMESCCFPRVPRIAPRPRSAVLDPSNRHMHMLSPASTQVNITTISMQDTDTSVMQHFLSPIMLTECPLTSLPKFPTTSQGFHEQMKITQLSETIYITVIYPYTHTLHALFIWYTWQAVSIQHNCSAVKLTFMMPIMFSL